jgi:hypothetical protein
MLTTMKSDYLFLVELKAACAQRCRIASPPMDRLLQR